MLFLYWILSMLVMRRENRLDMERKDMLARMGVAPSRANYLNLSKSIGYWQHMGMQFDTLYSPDSKKRRNGEFTSVVLGPPLAKRRDGTLIVNDDWMVVSPKSYYMRVQLPFTTEAYVQRLVLLIWKGRAASTRRFRSKRHLTRLLGINHLNRNEVLRKVIEDTKAWYHARQGWIICEGNDDGSLTFTTSRMQGLRPLERTKPMLAKAKKAAREAAKQSRRKPLSLSW